MHTAGSSGVPKEGHPQPLEHRVVTRRRRQRHWGPGRDTQRVESTPLVIGAAIVGVQRAGTSSLAAALASHPGICLADGKEAHLFDLAGVQAAGPEPARLEELFAHRSAGQLLLDATPAYVYMPGCIEALKRHNPEMRIIAVLRDPAERARSQHALELARGWEDLSFPAALRAERRRLSEDPDPMRLRSPSRIYAYRSRGRYAAQVARVLKHFPDALFLRFDDLVERPEATVERAIEHLGLDVTQAGEPLKKLNTARDEERSWREVRLRRELAGDARRTEQLLGWPRGSIAKARAPRP